MIKTEKKYKFKDKTVLHILTKLKNGKTLSKSDTEILERTKLCPADSRAADQMLIDMNEESHMPIYEAIATNMLNSSYADLIRTDKELVRDAGEKSIMHITKKQISDYLERERK